MPNEHVFKAGHQIAIIVGGTNTSMVSGTGQPNNVPVTLDARTSKVTLPIVGGQAALQAAGAFTDATGGVGGTVPSTLSLTLGAPASFGAFIPGVGRTYEASSMATVTSTAGDALLSVADPSSNATGHLVNGSFFLPQPLQARARNAANTGTAYNNVGSSASPLNLLTLQRPGVQRRGHARLQPADRRQRRAAHGDVQQDADVHAVDDDSRSVTRGRAGSLRSRRTARSCASSLRS